MRRVFWLFALVAGVMLLWERPAGAVNLVFNSDFESATLEGWTLTNVAALQGVSAYPSGVLAVKPASIGDLGQYGYYIRAGRQYGAAGIVQSLALRAGIEYPYSVDLVSYAILANADGGLVTGLLGGVVLTSLNFGVHPGGGALFGHIEGTFTVPTDGVYELRLVASRRYNASVNSPTIFFDNIIVDEPIPDPIEVTFDLTPDTLARTRYPHGVATAHIELPDGGDPATIMVDSLLLDGWLPPLSRPVAIEDYDGDGVLDLMVKFDKATLLSGLGSGMVEVELSGQLDDGTPIIGWDVVRVIDRPRQH